MRTSADPRFRRATPLCPSCEQMPADVVVRGRLSGGARVEPLTWNFSISKQKPPAS